MKKIVSILRCRGLGLGSGYRPSSCVAGQPFYELSLGSRSKGEVVWKLNRKVISAF